MALPEKKTLNGFPACVCLSITFNEHVECCQTLQEWVESQEWEESPEDSLQWVSDEEKQRAIATNSAWARYWCPDTPFGRRQVAASSFEALMAFINAAQ